jgi:hypothetical protein
MKFALETLLCALLSLAVGCASAKSSPASAPSTNSQPSTALDSAASLGFGLTEEEINAPDKVKPKGPAYLMRMIDYKSGARLELVNESHTSAVDQYSKVREDNTRKVASDDLMRKLIAYTREEGWSKEAVQGSPTGLTRSSALWSLELVGPDGSSYITQPFKVEAAQRKRLRTIQAAFIDTYNATQGFQAARVREGELPFKVPDYQNKKSGN